jgi:GDPmannose 4,6-dehydratase
VRGETFVTRKITRALARISLGLQNTIYLGNLDAKRDWGHAKDYIEMQWLMLQQDHPDDFVIATGKQYTVRKFVELAAGYVGIKIRWEGRGLQEKGYVERNEGALYNVSFTTPIVEIDERYFRPTEVDSLLGDFTKARKKLGWEPKITLEQTVKEMMENDLNIAKKDKITKHHGYKVFDYNE